MEGGSGPSAPDFLLQQLRGLVRAALGNLKFSLVGKNPSLDLGVVVLEDGAMMRRRFLAKRIEDGTNLLLVHPPLLVEGKAKQPLGCLPRFV